MTSTSILWQALKPLALYYILSALMLPAMRLLLKPDSAYTGMMGLIKTKVILDLAVALIVLAFALTGFIKAAGLL